MSSRTSYRRAAQLTLTDFVAAGTEDGEDGIAERALERAARQASVGFHVADLGLDGAAPSEQFCKRRGDPSSGAADQNARGRDPVAAMAAVDNGEARAAVGEDLHLLQRLAQRVAVIGIAGQRPHAEDKALVDGGGDADLLPNS